MDGWTEEKVGEPVSFGGDDTGWNWGSRDSEWGSCLSVSSQGIDPQWFLY